MSDELTDWTVTVDRGDIEVRRPSPHCTEHPWGYRAFIAGDVIAMVTPEELAELQAGQAARLKQMLVDAEVKFDHCTVCEAQRESE